MESWCIAISQGTPEGTPTFSPVRQLSDDEHRRLESVIRTLCGTLGRTAWHALQQNHHAFCTIEQALLDPADGPFASHKYQPESLQIAVTTTIVNFLSSMHMYLEHTEHHLKQADKADGGDRAAAWDAARRAEYDDYFAYRFLYKFRNYVQHVGLPLHALSIEHSLKDADDIAARVLRGEPPLVEGETSHDATVSIALCAVPSDLLQEFRTGAQLKSDLESLTTDIDLSEQIHVGMECLTRLESAFQETFRPELSRCVSEYTEIVGELHTYESRPFLMRVNQEQPYLTAQMSDMQPERFFQAMHLVADPTT